MSGSIKSQIDYNSRMVEIEVTGLCRQEIIRASNYRVKVPYSRLSQKMQEITRMGGKIKDVRMISSSLLRSPPSAETEGSQTEVPETEESQTEVPETEGSQMNLAEMTEVKPVRSKRKSVEAKKKSTTKTPRPNKLKRKPKSQK